MTDFVHALFYGLDYDEPAEPEQGEPSVLAPVGVPVLGGEHPACVKCGGPNLSLKKDRCIICRVALS